MEHPRGKDSNNQGGSHLFLGSIDRVLQRARELLYPVP